MANPWTNGSTALSAANMGLLMQGDGLGISAVYSFWILYTGAAWSCSNSTGSFNSAGHVSFNWDGTNDELEITISGLTRPFTTKPTAMVSPTNTNDTFNFIPQATASSTSLVTVQFFNSSGTLQTTEDAKMSFYLTLIGDIT